MSFLAAMEPERCSNSILRVLPLLASVVWFQATGHTRNHRQLKTMNLLKATIATAAVITCCLGNEMPAKAFWGDHPRKSAVADMMAMMSCKVRRGEISSSVAAVGSVRALQIKGWDISLASDPDVIRMAEQRMKKMC